MRPSASALTALLLAAAGALHAGWRTGGATSYVNSVDQCSTAWVARYDGTGHGDDQAVAVAADAEGNVYVTGTSYDSLSGNDIVTIKYNRSGEMMWVGHLAGLGVSEGRAAGLALDGRGNVYVAGSGWYGGLSCDFLVVKYRPDGDTAWVRWYDGRFHMADRASALAVDRGGNVYVTGTSRDDSLSDDYATVKYDSAGGFRWAKTYDGPRHGIDSACAVEVDSLGYVCVTGTSTGSDLTRDIVTIKYDTLGGTAWARTHASSGQGNDAGRAIAVDDSRNVYVAGNVFVDSTGTDCIVIKYSREGTTEWATQYASRDEDEVNSISLDSSGNVYVAGSTGGDVLTIKCWPSGETAWCRTYDGPGQGPDRALDLAVDSTGSVYVAGYCATGNGDDYLVIKYEPSGGTAWVRLYDGPVGSTDDAAGVALDWLGNVYVTGFSHDATDDYATLKYMQVVERPTVTVMAPNGGESWRARSQQLITCAHGGGPTLADSVSYSLDGGLSWLFAFREAALDTHEWTAPDTATSTARVKVSAINAVGVGEDISDSDFTIVPYVDVEVAQIIWPFGTIDSGASGCPRALVRNNGSLTETFPVLMRIGSSYEDTASVTLVPGQSETLTFADWYSSQRGTFVVACSTMLNGDSVELNNSRTDSVFVRVQDAGLVSIIEPDTVVREDTLAPEVMLRNLGNVPAAGFVRLTIRGDSAPYSDSQQVELGPGQDSAVTFKSWPTVLGRYTCRCSLACSPDVHLENDTASIEFSVVRSDVGVTDIVWPVGTVDSGSLGQPRAYVVNHGSQAETFPVVCRIAPDYCDTLQVDSLRPGENREVEFGAWRALGRGAHAVCCSTMLDGDRNAANNAARCTVFVRVLDAGVVRVLCPAETISRGSVQPRARIANHGNVGDTLSVWFEIRGDSAEYRDSLGLALAPGKTTEVEFDTWSAHGGSYVSTCWTVMAGDMQPGNDTAQEPFYVARTDAAVRAILYPADTIQAGRVEPQVKVANLSEDVRDVSVLFDVMRDGTEPVYHDSLLVAALARDSEAVVTFRTWSAAPGEYRLSACVVLGGDENHTNDTLADSVLVESLAGRGWAELAPLPLGSTRAGPRAGACLVSCGDAIRALKGSNTSDFSMYRADADSWLRLSSMPGGPANRRVKGGSALCWDTQGHVFALKGNGTREFWGYDVGTDSWVRLPDLPEHTPTPRYGCGLVYDAGTDTEKLYLVKGSNTLEFLGYWVQQREWHERRPLPPGPERRKARHGTSLVSAGGRVFCLKGRSCEFYEYVAGADSWLSRASMPLRGRRGRVKRCRKGAALASDGLCRIYAFKGSNCTEFWCYDVIMDSWIQLEDIPPGQRRHRVANGGSLAWLDGCVYALKGGGSREFWRYDPGAAGIAHAESRQAVLLSHEAAPGTPARTGVWSRQAPVAPGTPDRVEVYDAAGRRLRQQAAAGGPGVYFVRSGMTVKKIVLLR